MYLAGAIALAVATRAAASLPLGPTRDFAVLVWRGALEKVAAHGMLEWERCARLA